MNVHRQTAASPLAAADGGGRDSLQPAGVEAPSRCVHCGLPLTRLGARGQCLRCALRLGWEQEEDEPSLDEPATATDRRYGHFEVLQGYDGRPVELGSGAMGTTYRAQDTTLRTDVALKVISQSVASQPAARARFLREARAAARLHHPNVAGVFHYGEQEGECFYAMELVEGETLSERVQRLGPLDSQQALEVGVQVARALAAAEVIGVVHRDLKPSNLMLVGAPVGQPHVLRSGAPQTAAPLHVKVIDWGLAKAFGTEDALLGADHTRDAFVGTPAFASPEQFARAAERRVDVRSDIYSLGVTLWFLLCGKAPFVGDTLDAIHARQRVLPMEQLKTAKVPGHLAKALRSMLAFDPAARPQSARELLDTLVQCQRRCTDVRPAAVRRRRTLRFAAVLAAAALLGAGAWARWKSVRPQEAAPGAKPSVAVLPFENLSREPSDAFFTVGTQDEIANDLARMAALNVVGTESTRAYPPGPRDLPRIGQELGVRYLLEGNVQRQDDRVRIEVHLSDQRDPGHPWSETYTRKLNEAFAVQGEITRAVAAHVRATLSSAEKAAIDRPPTSDPAAYDLYLRARTGGQVFQSQEEEVRYRLETSIPLLQQAIARDGQFALAHAELANDFTRLVAYEAANGQAEAAATHRLQAEAALAKAIRLRPDASEVHLAQARHFYEINGNYEEAFQELDLARRALPNNAEVENLAGFLARDRNDWPEAVRCTERSVLLEPRDTDQRFSLAMIYRQLRRFAESEREIERVIASMPRAESLAYRMSGAIAKLEERGELAPLRAIVDGVTADDAPSPEIMVKARLVIALYSHDGRQATALLADVPPTGLAWGENRFPKAWFEALAARLRQDEVAAHDAFKRTRAEEEKILLIDPLNRYAMSVLAMVDAGLGDERRGSDEAQRIVSDTKAAAELSVTAPVVACHIAVAYAWSGQPDLACDTLAAWIDRPAGDGLVKQPNYGDFRLNPIWDPLRGRQRFEALVRRLAPEARSAPPLAPGSRP